MQTTRSSESIYSRPIGRVGKGALTRRRDRERVRSEAAPESRPPCREGPGEGWREIVAGATNGLEALEIEVEELERWAARRSEAARQDGTSVRRALDYLRQLGRLASAPLPELEPDDRARLVRLLGLELRWCYAAAGTDRVHFERATGRTGAR